MKNSIIFLVLVLVCSTVGYSTTHIIGNSGFTFTPADLTINLGDTVNFVVASIHQPREVDKATWDANGTTSNGGFDLPLGGGIVVLTQTGTHYYVCVPHASLGMKGTITVNAVTGVKDISQTIPETFNLMQNYPNPFNPSTTISFSLPSKSFVSLKVYDVIGNEVATIVNQELSAGNYTKQWNAENMSSGVYYYQLKAGTFSETKKLVLLR